MRRRAFTFGLGALTLAACATGRTVGRDDPLLFAYFTTGKKGEADGLKLAISADGFSFRALAGGRSLLIPEVGEKKLLRDPFLFHDGRIYHLLWTTAWEGVTIGNGPQPSTLAVQHGGFQDLLQGRAALRSRFQRD